MSLAACDSCGVIHAAHCPAVTPAGPPRREMALVPRAFPAEASLMARLLCMLCHEECCFPSVADGGLDDATHPDMVELKNWYDRHKRTCSHTREIGFKPPGETA